MKRPLFNKIAGVLDTITNNPAVVGAALGGAGGVSNRPNYLQLYNDAVQTK